MASELEGMRIAILATDGVEQAELVEPRQALNAAGAHTTLIAPKPGEIQAMKHDERADKFAVDATLDSVDPNQFDAVVLPGGAMNADALRVERAAQEFVRNIDTSGKPIAVICHGPWLLISAKLINGHKLTSYHTIQDDIRNAGGEWVNKEVVCDGRWLSSRQPSDIPAFNRQMIALFKECKQAALKVA